jgi:HAD superfamily hydrolase (TIGR01549 family)
VSLGPVDAVLYDWDGTLVDSAEQSFRCYEELFAGYGIRFDRDAYAATYSPNWHRTYVALGLPEDRWTEADARWVERYGRDAIPLIAGTEAALAAAAAAGLAQGLVTSGDRARVERELRAHGLVDRFAALVCGSDPVRKKPDPEALLLALERMGVPPARAAYVGDSPEDVEMAKRAGTRSIGIPGGFPNREALARSQPDLLAPSLSDAIAALIAARR